MSPLICRYCGLSMATGSLFCVECGKAQTAPHAQRLKTLDHGVVGGICTFFASQATLCLFTLLVFSGLVVALAPAGWRYANLQLRSAGTQPTVTSDSRSAGTSNAPARCNQIVVIFNSTATVSRMSALLEQLDATIAFGPNENGAFELSAAAAAAANVADALNRAADVVVSASLQRRCL